MAVGIVLAGRRNVGALRAAAPECAWEALIPIAGLPMAGHTIAALAGASEITRVVVAGPAELAGRGVERVEPGPRVSDTLRAALAAARRGAGGEELVVAAGDAPLLTSSAVAGLIAEARGRGLGLCYPLARRAACEARFPGVRRTYVRIREGSFTGGNCCYMRADAVDGVLGLLERLHADRKRPVRLARHLGWGVVWALLSGRARLRGLEAAASRLLGCPAGAWSCPDPGIGVDVDRPADLELCRAVLGAGPGAGG